MLAFGKVPLFRLIRPAPGHKFGQNELEASNMLVIAMTYDKSPIVRSVVGTGERVVYLALDSTELDAGVAPPSIGFPKEFVFEHDGELYAALKRASGESDKSELDKLWQSAQPYRAH